MATYTNFNPSGVTAASYTMEVSLPSFSLASGTYASQQQVAISDSTPGATIYFTTNGSTPTANSTKYTGPITVSSSETLLAVALEAGYQPSAVVTSTYVMEVAVPSFSVASGTYTAAQQVTISDATSGATIYYTTNGGIPSATSTKYTGPISVTSSEKIQAIAVDKSYSASPIAAASYTIN
jgi:N-acetyl-beta-hexosaminidase